MTDVKADAAAKLAEREGFDFDVWWNTKADHSVTGNLTRSYLAAKLAWQARAALIREAYGERKADEV